MQDAAELHSPTRSSSARSVSFDLDVLVIPLDDEQPTGIDVRENAHPNAAYYQLRDARTMARNNERSALAEGESHFISPGDWAPVVEQAVALLGSESKDLEVVAWLIEALTRTEAYKGAAAGFDLAEALIAQYGEALYPHPDEEGKATQLAALTGLNGLGTEGALVAPLKSIPLTQSPNHGAFAVWQCEQAFELERTSDPARKAQRAERGFASRVEIDQAVADTDPGYLRALMDELNTLQASFERYQGTVDDYSADDPQPTGRLRETIEVCQQTLRHIAGDRLAIPAPESTGPGPVADAEDGTQGEPSSATTDYGLNSRRAAVAQLAEVADFFRRTEPHSPMSYAIEQVVRWSDLSLPELIAELIPDENARQKYRTLTGIQGANEE